MSSNCSPNNNLIMMQWMYLDIQFRWWFTVHWKRPLTTILTLEFKIVRWNACYTLLLRTIFVVGFGITLRFILYAHTNMYAATPTISIYHNHLKFKTIDFNLSFFAFSPSVSSFSQLTQAALVACWRLRVFMHMYVCTYVCLCVYNFFRICI